MRRMNNEPFRQGTFGVAVKRFLVTHPGEEFSAKQIAERTGCTGARVHSACKTLAANGFPVDIEYRAPGGVAFIKWNQQ